MPTPEFLIWAIEHACPVRGFQNGSNPERMERQLRAAREVSEARQQGRVFEGLCLAPPFGFRMAEALAIYGGLAAVEQACGNCPANALAMERADTLAGCYGLVPLPPEPAGFLAAVDDAVGAAQLPVNASEPFPPTAPRWYGLWMSPAVTGERLPILHRILSGVQCQHHDTNVALGELVLGIQAAQRAGARLHVALYPRGQVESPWWRLALHCPRCKAEWTKVQARRCSVCGYAGHPAPQAKRRARGMRPYFPWDRLLGADRAAELLKRYAAFRAQKESPVPVQTPPRPAPPDNPPAG